MRKQNKDAMTKLQEICCKLSNLNVILGYVTDTFTIAENTSERDINKFQSVLYFLEEETKDTAIKLSAAIEEL